MKKPRSDSKLLTLPEEQQSEIFGWLKRCSFGVVREKLRDEQDLSVSVGALHNAWKYWSRQDLENRILKSNGAADDVLELLGGDMEKLDRATQAALQQSAFELTIGGGDPKTIKSFYELLLKARKLEQDETSLALKVRQYEDQINAAKNELTKAKADGGLDLETIERIEQQLNML